MSRSKAMIVVFSLACIFLFSGSDSSYDRQVYGLLDVVHQKIHGLYVKADEQHAAQMAEIAILRKEIEVEREVNRNLRKVLLLQIKQDLQSIVEQVDKELSDKEPVK